VSREIVVVTTDDLEPAVRLRAGFEAAGYGVELLTGGERLQEAVPEPVLVVLTGGAGQPHARARVAEARELGRVPVVALLEPSLSVSREVCRELGVSECFSKPIDVEEVVLVGRRLVERERLRELTGIVGVTDVMEEVLERVVQIAPVDATVLIEGESGTGKELVARGLHALSRRRHKPFIAVNVAALPDTLLESELFGHEKGAFTGAASLRKGFFELAHGGTIFLDEIGEMPLATQTKLLRVLEEREFRRVGGEDTLRVDVRVLAATNRNLREQAELGEFRRDLYHRLSVLSIRLPALRERRPDIPHLVADFVREFRETHDRPFLGLDPEALRILVEYDWPGNVRELRNLVESMVVLAPGRVLRPEDIPTEVRFPRRTGLLPVLARRSPDLDDQGRPPELEFVLRTLFDLRLDVEDLRRELDAYRRDRAIPEFRPLIAREVAALGPGMLVTPTGLVADDDSARVPPGDTEEAQDLSGDAAVDELVWRPGMTMEDLERRAILRSLRFVDGNRRKAAELLGIGERTLYRKIKEYDLEL
jgi:DNA-binding NtrC family response regulator